MLEIKKISKSIKEKEIVSNISFDVKAGDIFGLLGPNGAGKTTTFYMIAGLVHADNGKIILANKDISNTPMHQRSNLGIKYLPQEPSIFQNLSVYENLYGLAELSIGNKKDIRNFIDTSMEEFNLSDISNIPMHKRSNLGIKYLPQEPSIFQNLSVYENLYGLAELSLDNKKDIKNFIDTSMEEFNLSGISNLKGRQLSGGQRRKVEIARTLAAEPKIILLDEPFAGIDPIAIEDIKNVLKKLLKKDIGILITDHNVRETLEICTKAAIINNGEIIAQGDKQSLVTNDLVKKVYLGDMYN